MNRTSKTMSASIGSPYLYPKLTSWSVICSGSEIQLQGPEDALTELAAGEIGRVDDRVGALPQGLEHQPLLGDRRGDPAMATQRMAVPGLAEAPHEHVVARLQEEDLGPQAAGLQRVHRLRERRRGVTRANVDDDRHPVEPGWLARHQLGEARKELRRQVVDDGVAEVLEELAGGGLAGPREAGDHRDVLRLGHVMLPSMSVTARSSARGGC